MDDSNKTPGDVKVQPKVTLAKAMGALELKVDALLTETLKGFELDPADVKSRKRIFEAFVKVGAHFMVNNQAMKKSSLRRRADYAFSEHGHSSDVPKPNLTALDGGLNDDSEGDDGEGDDDNDE